MSDDNRALFCLEQTNDPPLNKVVYVKEDKVIYPCVILEGKFLSNGRVSNFWSWRNLITGMKESGYGNFWIARGNEE